MNPLQQLKSECAFSLAEVVIAIGIVSFAVLATFGLLSVANNTGKNARDEQSATRLAANEFARIRSLSATNFPHTYVPRYYDSGLADLGKVTDFGSTPPPTAVYKISLGFVPPSPSPSPTEWWIVNAEIAYPAQAPSPNQSISRFTTLMNQPIVTPTPTATATPGP